MLFYSVAIACISTLVIILMCPLLYILKRKKYFKVNKVIEKRFPSTRDKLDMMQDILFCEVKGLVSDRKLSSGILQASSEIIINAFEHGNQFNEEKIVVMKLLVKANMLVITIRDEGKGFDWKSRLKMQCVAADSLRGRGIHIADRYADEILYNKRGNKVILKFVIQ